MPSVVYPENNQVLILDLVNSGPAEDDDDMNPEDWTVVGKSKKKLEIASELILDAIPSVPEALKSQRKPKISRIFDLI